MTASIISYEAQGFLDVQTMFFGSAPGITPAVTGIFQQMLTNGFNLVFPTTLTPGTTVPVVTLEAGPTVDPLSSPTSPLVAQPWRMRFDFTTAKTVSITSATPIQLPNDGTQATYAISTTTNYLSGLIGNQSLSAAQPYQPFLSRVDYETNAEEAWPMSYKLAISDHGVALAVWEAGNDVKIDRMSWLCIQRSVSNTDGHITGVDTAGKKAPVFCIWHIKRVPGTITAANPAVDTTAKFVVRESDVSRPTESADATNDADDVQRSLITNSMVSILESGSYNISFIGGLNTQRYCYPQDELDMIAWTSADVISTGLLASFSAYGETAPRNYRALPATAGNNTNLRVLMYDSHQ